MGLRLIYEEIESQLSSITNDDGTPTFNHMHTWNDQFSDLLHEKNATDILIPFPACFIEVVVENIETEGVGSQLWNCNVKLHIAHQLYHAGDEYEQNWDVFDLVDKVHTYFHGYQPYGCGMFIEKGLTQDYKHGNLYHFIIEYKFNYVNEWDANLINSPSPLLLNISLSGTTVSYTI